MTDANLMNKRLISQLSRKIKSTLEDYVFKKNTENTRSEIYDRVMSILTDMLPEYNWNDIQYSVDAKSGDKVVISPQNEFTKQLFEKINNEVFIIS